MLGAVTIPAVAMRADVCFARGIAVDGTGLSRTGKWKFSQAICGAPIGTLDGSFLCVKSYGAS
jgi:hypothetical protein